LNFLNSLSGRAFWQLVQRSEAYLDIYNRWDDFSIYRRPMSWMIWLSSLFANNIVGIEIFFIFKFGYSCSIRTVLGMMQ